MEEYEIRKYWYSHIKSHENKKNINYIIKQVSEYFNDIV